MMAWEVVERARRTVRGMVADAMAVLAVGVVLFFMWWFA